MLKAVHIIPWDIEEWGVNVEYDDGIGVGFRAGTRENALAQVAKIRSDPDLAAKLRKDR